MLHAKSLQLCPILPAYGLQPTRLLCPWDSPGKNTGVGCHALLQGIFPTQGFMSPALPGGFYYHQCHLVLGRNFPPPFLGYSGQSKSSIDMRQSNGEKSKSLITCTCGRDSGKTQLIKIAENFTLNTVFSQRQKRIVEGGGLGLQRGGRQLTQRGKSKYSVNKCLLGHSETMRHRQEFQQTDLPKFFSVSTPSSYFSHSSVVIAPFLKQGLCLHSLHSQGKG